MVLAARARRRRRPCGREARAARGRAWSACRPSAFLVARLGGSASPESRHLIFVAPVPRDRRRSVDRQARPPHARARRRLPSSPSSPLEVAWAWHRTPALFEWEPDARQAARAEAETFLATTSRPDDLLFGYEPLYLGAWERNRAFPTTVLPRADARLALRTVEAAAGRSAAASGSSTPASATTSSARLEIERRLPTPSTPFEARVFGPFLVLRTLEPVATPKAFFYFAARALLVGQALGIGDADINVRTVVQATRELRGYGPSLRSRSSNSR